MKNATILHGISSHPEQFWFPYLKQELEKKQYDVWVPQLPQPDDPQLDIHLPWVLKHGTFTKDTVLIGHSSGASLILAILETIPNPIKTAILISGFLTRGGTRPPGAVKEKPALYDWKRMRTNAGNIFIINAANDPWGCDDAQGKKMFDYLGGTLIINNDGHMGSDYYHQPYKEFPLLVKLVELAETK